MNGMALSDVAEAAGMLVVDEAVDDSVLSLALALTRRRGDPEAAEATMSAEEEIDPGVVVLGSRRCRLRLYAPTNLNSRCSLAC